MNITPSLISLEDLLSFNLQQVQSHLDSLHSNHRARNFPDRFQNETTSIYIIVRIIDEFLNQQAIHITTSNRLHLLGLRAILYTDYQLRLNTSDGHTD